MNIHEYQAKQILAKYGVSVPKGKIAFTPAEAEEAAREFIAEKGICVVKAQIHAGGRGKAGGVKLAKSKEEAANIARELLGKVLETHQTGPAGKEVKKVYVEEGCQIARELYLGLVVDRSTQRVVFMASTEGGVEIEEVAAKTPEKILKEYVDPAVGLKPFARDGNIGCMVNGAGLAMATMDMIKLSGGNPANFLDVGGGANKEQVTAAFKLITSDPNCKGVLVNIFGGIMRCDIIAEGIIAAAKDVGIKVPLVVRLQGTNMEQGRKLLAESGLNIGSAERMDEAAEKAVEAARKAS